MNCLIVFYSRTGKNRKIANLIQEKTNGDVEEIIDFKKRSGLIGLLKSGKDAFLNKETPIKEPTKGPEKYDLIIVGTPVWAGKITPAVRTYLNRYKEKINSYAIFSVSGFGEKNKKIVDIVKSILKRDPKAELFISEKELKKNTYNDKINEFAKLIL